VDREGEQLEGILDLHHQEEVEAGAEITEEGAAIQEVDLEAMEEDKIAGRETIKGKGAAVIHLKIAIKNLRAPGLLNDVYYNFYRTMAGTIKNFRVQIVSKLNVSIMLLIVQTFRNNMINSRSKKSC
jgi:hypothetical protein